MLRISIDGACRRNGKPNCVSAGGVFIQKFDTDNKLIYTRTISDYELNSTNQRGEMLALLAALKYVASQQDDAQIITDSEYLFNAMTKDWIKSWHVKGWVTASGEPVKNKHLWEQIYDVAKLDVANLDVTYYHIKGHVIPFGKVTANTLVHADDTGYKLLKAVYTKFDTVKDSKHALIDRANGLSVKNNGFALSSEILRDFVVMNTVADIVATQCVESADSLL